jgi:ATP-binding cassette, subfamily B, bacterial
MLARALYKDAPVLILDEPTAALDAIAEQALYEEYVRFAKDKTSLFISHRLSSTRFCDQIMLLDGGKIIENGTHSALIKQDGVYASMYAIQSQYYQKEENNYEEVLACI